MASMHTIYSQYQQNIIRDKEAYLKDYKNIFQEVEKSPAKYKGKPVEFLYQPMFLDKKDFSKFQELTSQLLAILNKTIDHYLQEEEFRKHFGFSPLLEKMILKNPGYDKSVPMGRFDIFYHYDGRFQFCELNADGSSGMVEARELQQIIGQSLALRELEDQYDFTSFELFDTWVDALLENYQQFSGKEEKPNIAIVDWVSTTVPSEFLEFQKSFEKKGCSTVVADIRELEYKEGKLYYKDFPIDCIYRRAVTWEIIENQGEVKDFINAYLDGAVCVVGPIRSQIIHNKNIFSILHDPLKTPFLSEEERHFVEEHIPYTTMFDSSNKELVEFTINNKDELVLKPMDKYASCGVYIGRDFTEEEWIRIINHDARQDYLLQQFCHVPKIPMAMFTDEDVGFIENNYIIGLFMYNEKLQGVYTRVGRQNIIGSVVECFTIPNFIIEKKL
ncbi:Glutathionylspermidine synthase preATP-grasp [Anaerovirgula multivorans]|uniref:Glutathionylspermidine synthase preATP-grasp n=1 Tax=Anaerovirgula multivorans TaxID=312168 RepID=A0A239HAW3_9FIRM|nr:glutathionylspermidine synthase family protein [Anaerovirgula multivorans]SNS78576.1 Glutathionylspermidine synthase preATP-grasp [Anaerovirgula multivorans]